MPNLLADPPLPTTVLDSALRAYRFGGVVGEYISWTKGVELDLMYDQCTFVALHKPKNTAGSRHLLGVNNAGGSAAVASYLRHQGNIYRFTYAHATTSPVYDSAAGAVVFDQWQWIASVFLYTSGAANARVKAYWSLLGNDFMPLSLTASAEPPVGSPTNDSGLPLRIGNAGASATGLSYQGDLALVAAFRRVLRHEELVAFQSDPMAFASEAAFFVRPGHHHGLSIYDEGRNRKGRGVISGSPLGGCPTGVEDFWLSGGSTVDIPALVAALAAAIATAAAQNLSVATGTSAAITEAVASAAAQNLSVALGGLTAAITSAVATGNAQALSASLGTTAAIAAAVATGNAQGLSVSLGGLTAAVMTAVATGAAQNVTVTLGGLTVSMTVAVATGAAQPLGASNGLSAAIAAAVATGNAQALAGALGGMQATITPATATAPAQAVLVTPGGVTVTITTATATALAHALAVFTFALALDLVLRQKSGLFWQLWSHSGPHTGLTFDPR